MDKTNQQNIRSRRKPKLTAIQKTLIAGAAVASLAVGGAFVYRSFSEPTNQPQIRQRTEISFEDAQRDENLRQRYIEQKAASLSKEFEREFNTKILSAAFYDPDYRQLDELCKEGLEKYGNDPIKSSYFRNSIVKNQNKEDDEKCLGTTILPTANFAEGEPSNIYFPEECFDPELVASSDEFLSVLDHELFHAACNNTGVPIKTDEGLKYGLYSVDSAAGLNRSLGNECLEVAAYHYQLQNIEQGLRIVSPDFRQRIINSYSDHFQIVKSFADRNDGSLDSRFSAALIESLTYLPGPRKR